ncbi:MAG: hypothetical protein A3J62_03825 [Candidatus Buchananbacteria bacterium RIFCSPHIGHO2_02_FULL_38_8]|uniref:Cell division protein FtsL n=2 Tax=Candidatus Buchananiibacteriota TaxID=1817903 RepID=A0A1G1XWZ4_9BACT|nr:hypothetical protein [uncultured bacterium]OGY44106.1 MAG: hypothetical protein A2731_02825 [Candidatus Buchananbacteria bacterium RIFCSPHIGHO2_01_FULL_39_8]OGY47569.1 MAG: hypothetical protein A3J62_03825 [Candidatus Buchananbacteria bacterium RIFCSPHIGHO2_02_FULL_38_8]
MRKDQLSTIRKILSSKLTLLLGIIILGLIAVSFIKSWNRSREVNQEVKGLEQKIQTLQKDNLELSELIKYLNSTAYIEEKARTDLGLKKEGEKTVIIPELNIDNLNSNLDSKNQLEQKSDLIPNPKKWWHYFFSKK